MINPRHLVSLAAPLALACSLSAQVSYYSVSLAGENAVPPVVSPGGGYGIVRLQEPANTVRVFVHWFGLTGAPFAAHLHQGAAGSNGPVLVPLVPGPGTDTFVGTASLSAAAVALLKTRQTYVNVHTAANPGGEVRGQVVVAESTLYRALLDGGQAVPPVSTTASGVAMAWLHEPDNRLVYCVETAGLSGVFAAHLHAGVPGTNGGVVFGLNGSNGTYCGVSPRLTAAEISAIEAGGTYFNIHTSAHPGGELRGQLRPDAGSDFTATLDGGQTVPPVTTAGVGAASLSIAKDGVASVVVSFTGLSGAPLAAHIHNAPPGSNGGVVLPLGLVGGQYVVTFIPTPTQLGQLRNGSWYVNIHTALHPGGEIRGQLVPAVLATTYGPSCPTSGGIRPEIGAMGFAGLGAGGSVELYGGRPNGFAVLMFGFQRDGALGQPLPRPFSDFGLNAPCFFLNEALASVFVGADVRGCASFDLGLGFVPGTAGLELYAQWLVLDPGANPAGVAASNGLSMIVQ